MNPDFDPKLKILDDEDDLRFFSELDEFLDEYKQYFKEKEKQDKLKREEEKKINQKNYEDLRKLTLKKNQNNKIFSAPLKSAFALKNKFLLPKINLTKTPQLKQDDLERKKTFVFNQILPSKSKNRIFENSLFKNSENKNLPMMYISNKIHTSFSMSNSNNQNLNQNSTVDNMNMNQANQQKIDNEEKNEIKNEKINKKEIIKNPPEEKKEEKEEEEDKRDSLKSEIQKDFEPNSTKSKVSVSSNQDDEINAQRISFSTYKPIITRQFSGPSLDKKMKSLYAKTLRPMDQVKEMKEKKIKTQIKKRVLKSLKLKQLDEIEKKLKEHPLALYPHLEKYIPHNVFDEVVELLEPEMKKSIPEDYVDPYRLDDFTENNVFDPNLFGIKMDEFEKAAKTQEKKKKIEVQTVKKSSVRELLEKVGKGLSTENTCPYDVILEKEKDDDSNDSKVSKSKFTTYDQETQNFKATEEFVNFLATLSLDENNLVTKEQVANYFNNGFESKPPLAVPMEFIDMEGVPLELRRLTGGPDATENLKNELGDICKEIKKKDVKKRYKYGAWYIPCKNWEVKELHEPLVDPEDPQKKKKVQKSLSGDLDKDLAGMRGTKLFLDYAMEEYNREPTFLEKTVEIIRREKLKENKNK